MTPEGASGRGEKLSLAPAATKALITSLRAIFQACRHRLLPAFWIP